MFKFPIVSVSRSYEQQYCRDSNDTMKDYNKNLFFSEQGFVQYYQHISIEVIASNPSHESSMIPIGPNIVRVLSKR